MAIHTICAWCKRLLQAGTGPTSYGICPTCREVYFPKRAFYDCHLRSRVQPDEVTPAQDGAR